LLRALRVDKMTYAALEATLVDYLRGQSPQTVPVVRMIGVTLTELDERARRLARALDGTGFELAIVDGFSTIGGGSAPGTALPTRLVEVRRPGDSADGLETILRSLEVPIVARIEHDRVVLDLRTVLPDEDDELADLLRSIAGGAVSDRSEERGNGRRGERDESSGKDSEVENQDERDDEGGA
jgi:L-seryl-tRNA(Ser) seleniumtransferase